MMPRRTHDGRVINCTGREEVPAGGGIGRAIREARAKAGMSLRQLSEKVGVSVPFLHDLEHERRTTSKLPEIAKALDIDEEWLLGRSAVITRDEIKWLNDNPEVLRLLRDTRAKRRP